MAKKYATHIQLKHPQVIRLSRWLIENDVRLLDRKATFDEAIGLASTELGFTMSKYAFRSAAEASEIQWTPKKRRSPSLSHGRIESLAFRREVGYLLAQICQACDIEPGPITKVLAHDYEQLTNGRAPR
jgi:hypothetical protein